MVLQLKKSKGSQKSLCAVLTGCIHATLTQLCKKRESLTPLTMGSLLTTCEVVLGRGLHGELHPNSCFEAEVYQAGASDSECAGRHK